MLAGEGLLRCRGPAVRRRTAGPGSEGLVRRPVHHEALAGEGVPARHAVEAARAGHVPVGGALVVLEGGAGFAEEGRAAGALGVPVGDLEGEGAVVAVLEPGLAEVPVEHGAGDRVLLQLAGDVPGGGAHLGHLLRVVRGGGDGILGLLLRRLLAGFLGGGGFRRGGRAVALVALVVIAREPRAAHEGHDDEQDHGEQQAAAARDPGATRRSGVLVLLGFRSGKGRRGGGGGRGGRRSVRRGRVVGAGGGT